MLQGKYWQLLSDESLRKIDDAAVRLLTKVGTRVEHEGILDLLESAGCRIKKDTFQCWFAEKLIRDAVENFRSQSQASDTVELKTGWNPALRTGHGGSFPHVLDWPEGHRRLATIQDVQTFAKMAHVLPEFQSCGQVVTCAAVDPRVEPIWNVVERFRFTDKRIGGGEVLYSEKGATCAPLCRAVQLRQGKALR